VLTGDPPPNGDKAVNRVPSARPFGNRSDGRCFDRFGLIKMPFAGRPSNSGNPVMVVIRLARGGAKKRPFFNIVVADSRERRDGRFIERLGFYNPMAAGGEEPLRLALDRVSYWTGVGAQPSSTVLRLVDQAKAAI
jgi:small subunit ribosomal protein S16